MHNLQCSYHSTKCTMHGLCIIYLTLLILFQLIILLTSHNTDRIPCLPLLNWQLKYAWFDVAPGLNGGSVPTTATSSLHSCTVSRHQPWTTAWVFDCKLKPHVCIASLQSYFQRWRSRLQINLHISWSSGEENTEDSLNRWQITQNPLPSFVECLLHHIANLFLLGFSFDSSSAVPDITPHNLSLYKI